MCDLWRNNYCTYFDALLRNSSFMYAVETLFTKTPYESECVCLYV